MPTNDSNVTTEAQLISAIQTFSAETASASYTISITGSIAETADLSFAWEGVAEPFPWRSAAT